MQVDLLLWVNGNILIIIHLKLIIAITERLRNSVPPPRKRCGVAVIVHMYITRNFTITMVNSTMLTELFHAPSMERKCF